MAYTTAELDTKIALLEGGLARNELRVDFADRSVTYRSVSEQLDALTYFKRLLAQQATSDGTTSRSKQVLAVASRGF